VDHAGESRGGLFINRERQHQMDPRVADAAKLLAEFLVSGQAADRDGAWEAFCDLVVDQVQASEEALISQALDDLQGRGISVELVARMANQRAAGQRGLERDHQADVLLLRPDAT
jgi:hypothetical protein